MRLIAFFPFSLREVEAVWHQAIAEQAYLVERDRFGQDAFELQGVDIVVVDGEPRIGADRRVRDQTAFGSVN